MGTWVEFGVWFITKFVTEVKKNKKNTDVSQGYFSQNKDTRPQGDSVKRND